MRLSLVALALCAAAVAAAPKAKKGSDVLQLTDETFDDAIKTHDPLLVAFVAPWCGHCKKLKPEFERAAKTLKADGLRLAQVDATAANELASRFEVSGFPTLKFFRGGKASEYNGGREAAEIVAWVRKRSGPAYRTITNVEEAESMIEGAEVSVIAFASSLDSPVAAALQAEAVGNDDVAFGLVIGSEGGAGEVRAKYGVSEPEAVISLNDWEGEANVVTYTPAPGSTLQADATHGAPLHAWISAHSLPLVVTFTQEGASRIFSREVKTHLLLFADTAGEGEERTPSDDAVEAFREVAKSHRGKVLFVRVPTGEERVMSYFGVTPAQTPTAILVAMGSGDMKKYKPEGPNPLTVDALNTFLADYEAGRVKAWLKTAPAPDEATNAAAPVKVVTGGTFQSLVVDSDSDVLLEVYAPWCGHCKQLAPTYEALGKAVAAKGPGARLIIAKMDGTENEVDHPGVAIRGFPTLLFFPQGAKSSPQDYDGARDVGGFVTFLNKHATAGGSLGLTTDEVEAHLAEGGDDDDGAAEH